MKSVMFDELVTNDITTLCKKVESILKETENEDYIQHAITDIYSANSMVQALKKAIAALENAGYCVR